MYMRGLPRRAPELAHRPNVVVSQLVDLWTKLFLCLAGIRFTRTGVVLLDVVDGETCFSAFLVTARPRGFGQSA